MKGERCWGGEGRKERWGEERERCGKVSVDRRGASGKRRNSLQKLRCKERGPLVALLLPKCMHLLDRHGGCMPQGKEEDLRQ